MTETIFQVFEEECKELEVDAKLAKALHQYQVAFITKNRDHIEFFGGHLLGVHVVKFMPADRDRWFNEIVQVDDGPLENHLRRLPIIDPKHKIVASDTMNLSCIYLTHKIFKSKLPDEIKHQAMMDVLLVLQYKFFTSLMHQYFRFPADKDTAETTYAMLSERFLIKQQGTWKNLFNYRTESVLAKDSIWADVITGMDRLKPWTNYTDNNVPGTDDRVMDMLNDIQGRIRGIVKEIYAVLMEVHHSGNKIVTTSSVVEFDGEQILRDKTSNLYQYENYVTGIISDRNSFIKHDLVNVIEKMNETMSPRLFTQTLEYFSNNYHERGSELLKEIIHESLVHSFQYMSERENRDLVSTHADLPTLLARLRGVYTSSRTTNPTVLKLRKDVESIVLKATGSRNQSQQAAVRTGVLLYIVLCAVTMKHYVKAV
jgi:hypothetical protein